MIALVPATAAWYFGSTVFALGIAALVLDKSPSRVRLWEWLALVLPVVLWTILWSIPRFEEGKSLANLAEPVFLGWIVGGLALLLRLAGSRWLRPRVVRVAVLVASNLAAVLVVLYWPILPE